ncbi:hypothetical protein A0256_15965 [Mucilaginibacter sp. PAMC 26640]|nr:hypothetical protein A0256_15965 [Mucilaginibacter sp. PAMC 26640]
MAEYFKSFIDWLGKLGEDHHVNPLIFGGIYLGAKSVFLVFLGIALKNLRAKKPIFVPLSIAGAGYSLPYLYLIIFGTDISIWLYVYIGGVLIYAAYSVWKKVKAKAQPDDVVI